LAAVAATALSACGGGTAGPVSPAEIAAALSDVQRGAQGVPALVWHGARYPAADAATCRALIIDCEGGLGPIHHNAAVDLDLSSFSFLGRYNGVSLAEKTAATRDPGQPAYRAFAGWLEHGFFLIETPDGQASGDAPFEHRYYRAYSVGDATGTSPAVAPGGAATWSGAMWGLVMIDPDLSEPEAFVRGDAAVTVSSLQGSSDLVVNVTFSDIRSEATGATLADMRWSDLPLQDGSFGISPVSADGASLSRHPASQGITGRFYGPDHEEAGGLFGRSEVMLESHAGTGVRAEVSGAFGARRD
jgi:hypothetical protein